MCFSSRCAILSLNENLLFQMGCNMLFLIKKMDSKLSPFLFAPQTYFVQFTGHFTGIEKMFSSIFKKHNFTMSQTPF